MTGLGAYVAGFTAAEGTFVETTTSTRRFFAFRVAVGAADRQTCEGVAAFFGVGHLMGAPRRRAHHDDVVIYVVSGTEQLARVIVPFMDAHLPRDSYKWAQYERWRDALFAYRATRVRVAGGRTFSIDGCETRARAKGLCRHHYYEAYRR